ncbi:Egg cell-secreted protein 1.4 [Citrus sinensis]|uniref:Egg cell-secreted protein 1.4 n=1 Tax=Citrus sinensis TaxID=2711 RepID=A0ACB8IJ69_CITSI|nr:Egg cell-secreted protein 1.4 [Citrus sinensis]
MALKHVFFILALTCLIMANIANATSKNDRLNNNMKLDYDLATRLEANISPDCCRAIDIITRNCWLTMLTSLGFTAEEGNILRGYCDASSAPSPGGLAVIYQSQVSKFWLRQGASMALLFLWC